MGTRLSESRWNRWHSIICLFVEYRLKLSNLEKAESYLSSPSEE
jgi:hypothetical protein